MPVSKRLPPECTELILQYIWDDISTLHGLLLCSHEFFALVVPILYRDPFRLLDEHRAWTRDSRATRTAYLMRILHACATTKPSARDLSKPNTSESLPEVEGASSGGGSGGSSGPPADSHDLSSAAGLQPLPYPLTVDYLFYYTHQGHIPRAFRAFQLLNPKVQTHHKSRSAFEHAYAQASMTWALGMYSHFPSRIQVLSMTPSQLERILDHEGDSNRVDGTHGVGSLKMLRRLELDFGATNSPTGNWLATASAHSVGGDEENGVGTADAPLRFIREHQRIFPACPEDSLPDKIYDSGAVTQTPRVGGGTLLQEIVIRGSHSQWTPVQLLSNIQPLKVIDLSAWNSDISNLHQVPSARLKSLRINLERRLGFVGVPLSYLQQQCAQLEEIWMPSQEAHTFRWAIDLQRPIGPFASQARLRRRYPVGATNPAVHPDASDGLSLLAPHRTRVSPSSLNPEQIPRLKAIRLYGRPQELIPSLEDAADAFRDSLEVLGGFEDGFSHRDEYPRMVISWPLLQLTNLDLRGRFVYFFDLQSLRRCPNLKVVKLYIESDISSMVSESAGEREFEEKQDFSVFTEMWRLEELQLRGTSWVIDDAVLDMLTGSGSSSDNSHINDYRQNQSRDRQTGDLKESLLHFDIAEMYLPTRAGLKRFVEAMKKLRVIHLGNMYGYAVDSLCEVAGPRLFADIRND